MLQQARIHQAQHHRLAGRLEWRRHRRVLCHRTGPQDYHARRTSNGWVEMPNGGRADNTYGANFTSAGYRRVIVNVTLNNKGLYSSTLTSGGSVRSPYYRGPIHDRAHSSRRSNRLIRHRSGRKATRAVGASIPPTRHQTWSPVVTYLAAVTAQRSGPAE